MKYRIRISYDETGPRRWQFQEWHRGQYCINSVYLTREQAAAAAKVKFPDEDLMDPDHIKNMEEDTPE